jgi:uncharacterized protein
MTEKTWPRMDLKLVGDWGIANFHTILGILCANLRWRSAPGSTFWLKMGSGYRENVEAVGRGEADMAITTPSHVGLSWAREGRFLYQKRAYPDLRALGYYPQDDRLVLAVRTDTGIRSFEDIRRRKCPLRLATTPHDDDTLMTCAVDLSFRLHGIEPEDIERWGGRWMGETRPWVSIPQIMAGEADALFWEAISTSWWHEVAEKVPVNFIPFEPSVLAQIEREYGLKTDVLPKGWLRNDRDIPCPHWGHFAFFCRAEMDEDVAYRITAVLDEMREEVEARYRHLPRERAGMTWPIDPYTMWQGLGAPLHPGAERYYREHGYMR